MTDYSMKCGKESVREYVKFTMAGAGSFGKMLPIVICASLLTAMPIVGVIGYFMTNNPAMLLVTGLGVLTAIGIFVFMKILINSTTDKLMETYNKQDGLVCSVSESAITVVRDNRPVRVISWSEITSMNEGKHAFFLTENNKALIILDKSEVLSGSVAETSEIIAEKLGENK